MTYEDLVYEMSNHTLPTYPREAGKYQYYDACRLLAILSGAEVAKQEWEKLVVDEGYLKLIRETLDKNTSNATNQQENKMPELTPIPHWIIVSDEGTSTKPVKHTSYDSAYRESLRLSALKPGVNFTVYQYGGHAFTAPPAKTITRFNNYGASGRVVPAQADHLYPFGWKLI